MRRRVVLTRLAPSRLSPAVRRELRDLLRLPPPLLSSPEMALARRSERAAFRCPLERCAHPIGLPIGRWNPFVATAREILAGRAASVEGSTLDRYYRAFQPRNAGEALLGFVDAPPELRRSHPTAALCTPWQQLMPQEIGSKVRAWVQADHHEHGVPDVNLDHGFKYFGPVDNRLAALEFERLRALTASLQQHGYQRRRGDVFVEVLKRDHEYLFLTSGGGMHRTVASAAVGLTEVPARPVAPLIDVNRASDWPNVRSGLWSLTRAKRYFHHLFDFDFLGWAVRHRLVTESPVGVSTAEAA